MSRESAIEAVKVALQREFGGFLAHDPYNPERFWTMQAEAVIDAAAPSIQAQALRDAAETVRRYNLPDTPGSMYPFAVADALCERADRIELP